MIAERTVCKCLRCEHVWLTDEGTTKPKQCAKCHSKYWNKRRERAPAKAPEVRNILEKVKATGPLFRAIKALAALDVAAAVAGIEPWQSPDVDPYLSVALANLTRFEEAWRGQSR